MKPTRTIDVGQAERMYALYSRRIHIPKEHRKGKTPTEIQNLRKRLFVKYLAENDIEIKLIEKSK